MAKSLVDAEWQFGSARDSIFTNIKSGIPHMGMPAFEGKLSDEDIGIIIAFLDQVEGKSKIKTDALTMKIQTLDYSIGVETWVDRLSIPWAIDFLDGNTALVTERGGRLWIITEGKLNSKPVSGIPQVLHQGQGGLLDVAIDPEYIENYWIYLSYSHVPDNKLTSRRPPAMTRIVRGRIRENTWLDEQVIFEASQKHYSQTRHHYGCRIVFDKNGYLYFSIGDRGAQEQAQDLSRPNGKIHRINRDGSIPKDNPFVDQDGALASIFTYGNRNAQGLAVHPDTDMIWETEHGPMGGDELNLLSAGLNYGWPEITYGLNYNGTVISEDFKKPEMESPILYWTPSIAVCGLDFYTGDQFPRWHNDLIVGALKYEEVRILDLEGNRVLHEEVILKNHGRVRDVACGPDGAIYVVLNEPGRILRLTRSTD
jgi:glucose/arabinose dehydrogenase